MGIFDALNTSVGGLQAQSFALQNISGNIANAQTTGFKGINTTLRRPRAGGDQSGPPGRGRRDRLRTADGFVAGHGVGLDRRHLHGDQRRRVLLGAEVERHGRQRTGLHRRHQLHAARRFPGQRQRQSRQRRRLLPDGRRGRFQDRQSARQRAAGAAIPEQLRAGAGDHHHSIRPQPSGHAGDGGESSTATAGTITAAGGLDATVFSRSIRPLPGTGTVVGNDATLFQNQSISGGAVTAYDASGTPVNLQLRWAKTDSAALGGTHADTWESVLSERSDRDRHRRSRGSTPAPISPSAPTAS